MKNKKLIILIAILITLGVAGVAVGATAAYWTESSANTGIAPQAFTYDYTVWVKYVTWEFVGSGWSYNAGGYWVNESASPNYNIAITGFKDYLGEDVVIPTAITIPVRVNGAETTTQYSASVSLIRNTIFSDVTLKAMPTSLVIPPNVTVEAAAFSGLTNLKEVSFGGSTTNTNQTVVGEYAFSGCNALEKVVFEGETDVLNANITVNVLFKSGVFGGCVKLTQCSTPTGSLATNSGTDGANVVATYSNWSNFCAYVSAPNLANPYSAG